MRLTKNDLYTMAQSKNADDRKRAFKLYLAWINDKTMPPRDQFNFTERYIFDRVFTEKGMTVPGFKPPPPRRSATTVPSTKARRT